MSRRATPPEQPGGEEVNGRRYVGTVEVVFEDVPIRTGHE